MALTICPNHVPIPYAGKNGKTLHLLKAGSKPIATDRKRRKIQLLGSFGEYQESKKKPVPSNNPIGSVPAQGPPSGPSSILQFMAPGPQASGPANTGKDNKMKGK